MIKLFYAPGTCALAPHIVLEWIADAYAFAMIRWGNNLPKPLSDYPNLDRFHLHLREDGGVQQAMKQQGIQ